MEIFRFGLNICNNNFKKIDSEKSVTSELFRAYLPTVATLAAIRCACMSKQNYVDHFNTVKVNVVCPQNTVNTREKDAFFS